MAFGGKAVFAFTRRFSDTSWIEVSAVYFLGPGKQTGDRYDLDVMKAVSSPACCWSSRCELLHWQRLLLSRAHTPNRNEKVLWPLNVASCCLQNTSETKFNERSMKQAPLRLELGETTEIIAWALQTQTFWTAFRKTLLCLFDLRSRHDIDTAERISVAFVSIQEGQIELSPFWI